MKHKQYLLFAWPLGDFYTTLWAVIAGDNGDAVANVYILCLGSMSHFTSIAWSLATRLVTMVIVDIIIYHNTIAAVFPQACVHIALLSITDG